MKVPLLVTNIAGDDEFFPIRLCGKHSRHSPQL